MSYRVLVTTLHPDGKSDFVLQDGDMGDLMRAKDGFIGMCQGIAKAKISMVSVVNWLEAYYPTNMGSTYISLTMWIDGNRDNWIKTYADRHYEVDLITGIVSSPKWSTYMDRPRT